MSKEEVIAAIQESAARLGHVPTFSEVRRSTKMSKHEIRKHFLTYSKALSESGLQRTGPGYEVDARLLFQDWAGLVRKLGKLPTMAEYEMHGSYSVRPLIRRYGGWVHVPAGLMEFAREERLEGEWGDVLDVIARHKEEEADGRRTSGSTNSRMPRAVVFKTRIFKDRPVYGAPMMDMALGLAPTNEMGVVFLFGTVAKELGFMVIRLHPEFPDCEAFLEVEPGRWQWVRIEFEYESRNFLAHGHKLDGCDLIVCWRNNWEGCPLEVIELSKVMEEIRKIG
ncbi:MAG TPA: hypothetical protein VFQ41_13330 [Candidatus Angelobacter sp.]|nr:hypothetical protein [Candidatus Angelobacter sp.]